ncbi:peptidoglycan/LPS O-acetylase OafA/YrhL [Labedella gwakjiensis]|uniref:Acyltransferase n=1 Tax=Labedella gwakjiensis TaxID=390269 RepID=A0A2P8GRA6_9MICO|nr:acyltransferase family protein [Labedella gwakjiensis]PSL36506.1 peptidoglycan/LPS O-acetylase OafA/YrhL [Labedella gwakjiensis]RUQ85575.1 acyltransferase [Labedella gwakjiensis]
MTSVRDRSSDTAGAAQAPERRPFRADIQGLRALAVVLVVVNHAVAPLVPGGYVGVDVFFVISGFLISGHLVESLERTGRISFVRFYAARARRILPAALVTIAATSIAAFVLVSPLRIVQILQDAIASALYVPNIVFAIRQTDYLAGTEPSPFQHFWSLGVEEQFYLVWPVLLLGAFVLGRRSIRVLLFVIGVITAASLLASIVTTPESPSLAFFSPWTRAWEFGVGALVAGGASLLGRVPPWIGLVLGWAGLGMIVAAATTYTADLDYPGAAALLPVVGTALVIASGGPAVSRWSAARLLALRPMQVVGAISYSLYLVHWPILVLAHERIGLDEPLPVPLAVGLAVASVPAAWILYRLVETPLRSTRSSGRRVMAASTVVSLVLVGGLVSGSAAAAQMPLATTQTVPRTPVTEMPTGTDIVPANLSPDLRSAVADTGAVYTDGCQQNLRESEVISCAFGDLEASRTIALFGDSHAGRWFPALEKAAEALGYRLETYTKSGCRTEETAAAWSGSKNESCSAWRDAAVEELAANPPDVILLANHLGPTPGRDAQIQRDDWVDGLSSLYDRLPASSLVVSLADTPEFESSPVVCLSSHLDDAEACAIPRSKAFNPAIREAQQIVADDRGGAVVDLSDYFCNASTCPAIIGATLVYSDEHHVTATFSRSLARALEERLVPVLAGAG